MIQMSVEPYCHNCPEFQPVISGNVIQSFDFTTGSILIRYVECEHKERCKCMYEHIKETSKNGQSGEEKSGTP